MGLCLRRGDALVGIASDSRPRTTHAVLPIASAARKTALEMKTKSHSNRTLRAPAGKLAIFPELQLKQSLLIERQSMVDRLGKRANDLIGYNIGFFANNDLVSCSLLTAFSFS